MTEFVFVFDEKRDLPFENIIYIDEKKGDFRSLESFLIEKKGQDPYNFPDSHLNIKYFSEDDVFISPKHSNPLALRLQETLIPRDCLVITENEDSLEEIILNKFNYEELDYDIFSGEVFDIDNEEYKIEVLGCIRDLSFVLNQMLGAGYLSLKNNDKIDDWIITFQDPILDLFIRYHQLETSAGDFSVCDEFLINPEYRKTICLMLMKIISNFVVNNDIVTTKKISEMGGWKNLDLWSYIDENIKMIF